MDKKGQTLIIFVILIPIILTMLAMIVDVGMLSLEHQKVRGVIESGIKEYFEKKEESEIKKILEWNEIPTDHLNITVSESTIEVSVHYQIDSLFGKIININQYDIEVIRVGKIENNQVIITKKE